MVKRRYTCKTCDKSFLQKKRYQDHVELHNKSDNTLLKPTASDGIRIRYKTSKIYKDGDLNEYICTVCSKVFKSKFKLIRHTYIHMETKPFKCDICGRGFTRKDHLKVHYRLHTGENRSYCKVCCRGFSTDAGLEKHVASVHSMTREDLSCPYCEIDFPNKGQMKKHFDYVHRTTYMCYICGFSSYTVEAISRHERTHLLTIPYYCINCGENFDAANVLLAHECAPGNKGSFSLVIKVVLDEDMELDEEVIDPEDAVNTTKLLRKFDGRGRKPKSAARDPVPIHTPIQSTINLRCKYCDKLFESQAEKLSHEVSHLSGDLKLTCSICKTMFSDSIKLLMHLQSHTGENLHTCGECNQNFLKKQWLLSHMKTHGCLEESGIYSCKECPYFFALPASLEDHESNSHSKTDTQTYQGSNGDAAFSSLDELSEHNNADIAAEGQQMCCYCGEIFESHGKCKQHEMICVSNPTVKPVVATKKHNILSDFTQLAVDAEVPDSFEEETDVKTFVPENLLNKNSHGGQSEQIVFSARDYAHVDQSKAPEDAFSVDEKLPENVLPHNNIAKQGCVLCDQTFSSTQELQDHLSNSHDNYVLDAGEPLSM